MCVAIGWGVSVCRLLVFFCYYSLISHFSSGCRVVQVPFSLADRITVFIWTRDGQKEYDADARGTKRRTRAKTFVVGNIERESGEEAKKQTATYLSISALCRGRSCNGWSPLVSVARYTIDCYDKIMSRARRWYSVGVQEKEITGQ